MILPVRRSRTAKAPLDSIAPSNRLKDFSFVAVAFRMLLQMRGFAGGSEERVEVRGHERAQFDEPCRSELVAGRNHVSAQTITVTRQPHRWHVWNYSRGPRRFAYNRARNA